MASSMSDGSRLSRSTSSIGIFFAYDNEAANDVIIFADRLKHDLEKNGFSVQKVQELMYYEEDGGIPKIDQLSKFEAFLAVTTNKHSCTDSKFCQILHANKIDTNKIYEIFYEKEDGDVSLRCKHDVPMAPEQNQFVFKPSDDHESLLNKLVTIFKSSGVQGNEECKSDDTCILQEVTDTKAASKKINFQVIGNKHATYTWNDYDFSIKVPATAVPQGITVDVPIEVVPFTQDFLLPENMYLVSEIYYINVKHEFRDKVTVRMKHRANVDVESFQSNLKILFAKCSDGPPHVLQQLPLSCDFDEKGFVSFRIKNFSDFVVASDAFMCKAFFHKINSSTRWEMVVVMMQDRIDHIKAIVDYYTNDGYERRHEEIIDVHFNEGCKEITIQVSDVADDGWEVHRRSSDVQIKAKQILDFNPSNIHFIHPPSCTFDITWRSQNRSPQESRSPRKVSLIGTKGNHYFNLFIPPVPLPPSYNEASATPMDPPPPYHEQQVNVEPSYIS